MVREHFEGVTVQPMIDWAGYELIVGSSIDAQFGPVLLFGLGGQLVEVFRDRALGLPPLTTTLARRMIERTRIYEALRGVRGRDAVDLDALEQLLVRFSELVVEQPQIADIEINPLLVSSDRMLALDARVILQPAGTPAADLPRPAIRPYPLQYSGTWTARDGSDYAIRPIRPEDETHAGRSSTGHCPSSRSTSATSRTWASASASRTSGSSGSASATTTGSWHSSPRSPMSMESRSSPESAGSRSCAMGSAGSSRSWSATTIRVVAWGPSC